MSKVYVICFNNPHISNAGENYIPRDSAWNNIPFVYLLFKPLYLASVTLRQQKQGFKNQNRFLHALQSNTLLLLGLHVNF